MNGPGLAVSGLAVRRGGREILRDVSFSLASGTFCGLIGPNGVGKTSLLRALLGLDRAAAGTIALARPAGYVPQKLLIAPDMPLRARDLIALGYDGGRFGPALPSARRRARVAQMLEAVEAQSFADQRVGEISGGQLQRVLIAHALAGGAKTLLLDEPLASLDLRAAAQIVALLQRIAAGGVTVLVATHDMNPLLGAMDRLVYIAGGRAVSGRMEEVVRTEVLSALYGYHIDVIRVHGRIVVVAGEAQAHHHGDEHVAMIP